VPGGFAPWENGREVTVEADKQLANLDFTLPPFKQGRWKTYTHENGLAGTMSPALSRPAMERCGSAPIKECRDSTDAYSRISPPRMGCLAVWWE
jgi:hypothetical protein